LNDRWLSSQDSATRLRQSVRRPTPAGVGGVQDVGAHALLSAADGPGGEGVHGGDVSYLHAVWSLPDPVLSSVAGDIDAARSTRSACTYRDEPDAFRDEMELPQESGKSRPFRCTTPLRLPVGSAIGCPV